VGNCTDLTTQIPACAAFWLASVSSMGMTMNGPVTVSSSDKRCAAALEEMASTV